jgi:photosystem II stability/assembly factor-like uncharacterized protein
MNMLNKTTPLIFFLLTILSTTHTFGSWQDRNNHYWKNIHLRTERQQIKNLIGGEGFQQLMDIEYSPSDPKIIYFTSDTSQVWKSTNSGRSWFPTKNNNLTAIGGLSLLVDEEFPDRVLLAGFTKKDTNASGIYLTTNGGKSWKRVYNKAGYKKDWVVRGQDLFIRHNSEIIAAVQNGDGLVISDDQGETWSQIEFDDQSDIQNNQLGFILNTEKNPYSSDLEIWISSYSGLFKVTENNYGGSESRFHCEEVKSARSGLPSKFTGWKHTRNPDDPHTTTFLDSIVDYDNKIMNKVPSGSLRLNFEYGAKGYWHTKWEQLIDLYAGTEYTLSGSLMLNRGEDDNNQGGVYISVVEDSDNNVEQASHWNTEIVSSNTINPNNNQLTWKNVSERFIPDRDMKVKVVLKRLKNSAVRGSAWYDNIKLYPSHGTEKDNLLGNNHYATFHGDTPTAVHFGENPDEIIVSAGFSGIYRSIDGGETFSLSTQDLPGKALNKKRIHLDGSRSNPHVLVAGFSEWGEGPNYISTDGALNWSRIDSCSLDEKELVMDIHPVKKLHKNYWSTPTGFHPTDQNKMIHAFHGSLIYRSTTHQNNNSKCASSLYWKYSSEGYSGGRAGGGFSFGNKNSPRTSYFFLTDYGPFVTRNGGRTWKQTKLPEGIDSSQNASAGDVDGDLLITSIGSWMPNSHQQIIRSENGGNSWSVDSDGNIDRNNLPDEDRPKQYKFVAIDPIDNRFVYAGNYISRNQGYRFEPIEGTEDKDVIAISPTTGDIYAQTALKDNNISNTTQIWRSSNKGATWNLVSDVDVIPVKPKQLEQIAISPKNDNLIYAVTRNNGVYILREDGRWEQSNHGITQDTLENGGNGLNTKYIAIDPINPDIIYIGKNASSFGQSDGILVSTDSGETWKNISSNLGNRTTLWGIKANPNNDAVYIATSLGTWAMSALVLNYHFDRTDNDPQTVHNDSIHSITKYRGNMGDAQRGSGTSITNGWHGGTALRFDGSSNAYVSLPKYTRKLKNIHNSFTVEAIVRIDSQDSLQNSPIVSDKNRYNEPGGFLLRSRNQRMVFSVAGDESNPDEKVVVRSKTRLRRGTWYHVVATFHKGVVKLYINGNLEDDNSTDVNFERTVLQDSNPLYLGSSRINEAYFNGAIDEVRIYDSALTVDEINKHHTWFHQ